MLSLKRGAYRKGGSVCSSEEKSMNRIIVREMCFQHVFILFTKYGAASAESAQFCWVTTAAQISRSLPRRILQSNTTVALWAQDGFINTGLFQVGGGCRWRRHGWRVGRFQPDTCSWLHWANCHLPHLSGPFVPHAVKRSQRLHKPWRTDLVMQQVTGYFWVGKKQNKATPHLKRKKNGTTWWEMTARLWDSCDETFSNN